MGSRGASSNTNTRNKQLNTDEEEALLWYISGDGMWINQYYRGNADGFFFENSDRTDFQNITAEEKAQMKAIDNATNRNLEQQTLYRSVDAETIFGKLSDVDYDNLIDKLVYKDNNRYANAVYEKAMKNIKKTYTEKGLMSTTKDYSIARDWRDFTGSNKPVVLEIKTSKGTKGIDLTRKNSKRYGAINKGQKEVLLARGQSYSISKIGVRDDTIYIKVKMK